MAGVRGAKLAESAEKLAAIAGSCAASKEPTHIRVMLEAAFERMKHRNDGTAKPGVDNRVRAIDEIMNPMRGGQVIVVGGRPSSGKTSLVNRWFVNAAMQFMREFLNDQRAQVGAVLLARDEGRRSRRPNALHERSGEPGAHAAVDCSSPRNGTV
jgi:replicative DNA helicase